jgi:hypothetical protein
MTEIKRGLLTKAGRYRDGTSPLPPHSQILTVGVAMAGPSGTAPP